MRSSRVFQAGGLALAPLWLLLGLTGCAFDLEVAGVVRDAHTRLPVEGALIQIGDRLATSDEDGRYALTGIERREQDPLPVRVTALGYDPIREVRRLDPDQDREAWLDFNLRGRIVFTTTTQPASAPRSGGATRKTVVEVAPVPEGRPPIQERAGPGEE